MPRKTCSTRTGVAPPGGGFNEAAARCRGKLRPRRWTAAVESGFNEAAARCRGKRGSEARRTDGARGFNEAAARCRGKPTWPRVLRSGVTSLQ